MLLQHYPCQIVSFRPGLIDPILFRHSPFFIVHLHAIEKAPLGFTAAFGRPSFVLP